MKLHLPKTLLAAVVAALFAPAAYADDYTLEAGENLLDGDKTINNTQTVTGDVKINGRGYEYKEGYSLTLGTGANVSIKGDLWVASMCHLNITDGSLSAEGEFFLGHWDPSGYPADLVMTGGNLSVSKISFYHKQDNNKISITGGTLTITGETAITQDPGHDYNSTVFIGGEEGRIVTLKTGDTNNVTFDYSKLQLGNVTIDANNARAITITNATLSGTITNSGGAQTN